MGDDVDVNAVPIPWRNVADENCGAGRGIAVVSSLQRWQIIELFKIV